MILWTIQHYSAYERMLETGILNANENHLFCQDVIKPRKNLGFKHF